MTKYLMTLLLEEAHQITFHQRCINSLMIEVYKYLNGNLSDIMNDIFKLRKNVCNLRNFHIFQTENPRSLKYGLDAILYRASQLLEQLPLISVRQLLWLFSKISLKLGNLKIVHVDLAKYLFKMSSIFNWGPLVTD